MKKKIDKWINNKAIVMRRILSEKSEGMGTVEVVLIIVCLIGIVIIFKSEITDLVESIFSKITSQANRV